MITTQFILYNIVFLLVILHFLDSAKECEWTEKIYMNNYHFWLITSGLLIVLALIGIVPVYLGTTLGQVLSYLTGIGGIGAAGYHIPMNIWKNSKVCNNTFSYVLMGILAIACILLLFFTTTGN